MRLLSLILATLLSITMLASAQPPAAKKAADTAKTAKAAVKEAPKELVDLNTAKFDELKALPAIGDAIAKKIIAARPFRAKNELVSKGIMNEAAYNKVKDMIIAKQAAKK